MRTSLVALAIVAAVLLTRTVVVAVVVWVVMHYVVPGWWGALVAIAPGTIVALAVQRRQARWLRRHGWL